MFRSLFLFVFFWACSPFLAAQLMAQSQFGDLYDDFDFPGMTTQAPRNHVALTCRFNEKHLVIQAELAPNWHLYSATQPEGGTLPTRFVFESPEFMKSLREIRPTTPPLVNSDDPFFDVDLEEHEGTVTWILTFEENLPSDQTIKGKLHGMVCQTGEGGMCIPITESFEAVFDPDLDVKPLQEQAESVADRFVFRVDAAGTADTESPQEKFETQETVNVGSLWVALGFAFLGGIVLNFMPCVLPVIGLKILAFFEQAGKSRARAFMLNVWYSLGLLTVFLVLAFMSLGLSILFTFDLFGILMACVVFVMALSLMDVWTLSVPGSLGGKTSEQMTKQEGVLGAYFKGIITTLLAIPCGAPFLSPAINWADMQIRAGNMPEVFLMYSVIGLGMASPYLFLGAFPELLRFLPKPGEWMETFKKTMGFCLLLAVVWILYFIPVEKLLPTITLLFALWFICWLFGEQQLAGRIRKRSYIISSVVLGLVLLFSYQLPGIPNSYTLETAMRTRIYGHEGEHWKPYSDAAFASARASGKTIIVDFTADWCVNCKVLEATVLQSEAILALLEEKQIVSLVADCTRDGEAKELLLQLGSFQVPTLAIFDPAKPLEPQVIRGFYTQTTLTELLK
jgi:thiol:disulfide interchange protein DsbD